MSHRRLDKASIVALCVLLVGQSTTLAIFGFPYAKRISWVRSIFDATYEWGSTMLGLVFLIALLGMICATAALLWCLFRKDDGASGNSSNNGNREGDDRRKADDKKEDTMRDGDVLNWLASEAARNQTYHDHKENMAWVATALYVSGAFLLGSRLGEAARDWQSPGVIVAAVMITGLAFWFVTWQFNNRRTAALRVKRLIEAAENCLPPRLAWYFDAIRTHKYDPEITVAISLIAMVIAFIAFLLSLW